MSKQTYVCHNCGKIFIARPLAYGKPRKFCTRKCYELNKRILTDEQCKEILSLYSDGASTITIAKVFGVAHTTIKSVLIRANIEIGGRERYRKFTLDENKFDKIDNEHKAYWLGFIYADGYVRKDGLTIRIKSSDIEHLKKIRKWFSSDAEITHNNSIHGNTVTISFNSYHLARRLDDLGIVPYRLTFKKSIDAIPEKLIIHFIRGLIDGDGFVTKIGSTTPNIGFCGQKDVVLWMKKTLIKKCELKGNPKIRKHGTSSYEVAFGGIFQIKKILRVVYNNPRIFLDRKKELADYWLEKRVSRYEH